jgi:hypothetical protein
MALMKRQGRKKKGCPAAAVPARNPLDAVPVIADGIETKTDNLGLLQLRRARPIRKGMIGALVRRYNLRRATRVDLDDRGTMFWILIDGKRTLGEIARTMTMKCAAGEGEMNKAVMIYTKALMLRGCVGLKVATEAAKSRSGGA